MYGCNMLQLYIFLGLIHIHSSTLQLSWCMFLFCGYISLFGIYPYLVSRSIDHMSGRHGRDGWRWRRLAGLGQLQLWGERGPAGDVGSQRFIFLELWVLRFRGKANQICGKPWKMLGKIMEHPPNLVVHSHFLSRVKGPFEGYTPSSGRTHVGLVRRAFTSSFIISLALRFVICLERIVFHWWQGLC